MFNYFKKNKLINKQNLIFFVFLILFSIVFLITEKYSQSFHFVDEEEHLVVASFMNKGYRLYTDLSSNHQPLVYVIGSFAQKISHPDNLFSLIKSGREATFFYSLIFSFLLLLNFGPIYLIFALFFELTKFFIFGNLLLAESLVIYPLIFLVGETFRALFNNSRPRVWQQALFGLCCFLIAFNLLPIIPSMLMLVFMYLVKTKSWRLVFLGFVLPTLVLFVFISPTAYIRETVINNWKYAIPVYVSKMPQKSQENFLRIIFFPLLSWFKGRSSILNYYIQFFTVFWLLGPVLFLRKNKKSWLSYWLLMSFIIMMLNNRVLVPGEMYYFNGAFHILPWYAAFIFFVILAGELFFKKTQGSFKYLFLIAFIVSGSCLLLNKHMPYFVKIDKNNEHNVNYLPYYLIGKAFKTVSKPTDRLAVFPHESLIYWQSGLKPATRQVVYYEWEYNVPELNKDFKEVFNQTPPEFIYANFDQIGLAGYLPLLQKVLAQDYWQVTKDGVSQNLFLKKDIIKQITPEQWQEWQKLSFDAIKL